MWAFKNGVTWFKVIERQIKKHLEARLAKLFDQLPDDTVLEEMVEIQLGLNLKADKDE